MYTRNFGGVNEDNELSNTIILTLSYVVQKDDINKKTLFLVWIRKHPGKMLTQHGKNMAAILQLQGVQVKKQTEYPKTPVVFW